VFVSGEVCVVSVDGGGNKRPLNPDPADTKRIDPFALKNEKTGALYSTGGKGNLGGSLENLRKLLLGIYKGQSQLRYGLGKKIYKHSD